jgi:hypothetical protein
MKEGWNCPKCNKVWNPDVEYCKDCGTSRTVTWPCPCYPNTNWPYVTWSGTISANVSSSSSSVKITE